jgi:hypothetical protein
LQHLRARVSSSSSVLALAAQSLPESDAEEAAAWLSSWARHSRRVQAEHAELAAALPQRGKELAADVRALEARQQALARQYAGAAALGPAETGRPSPEGLSDIAALRAGLAPDRLAAMTRGGDGALEVIQPAASLRPLWLRLAAALAILLAAVGVWTCRRSSILQEIVTAWPQLLGMLVGVAWWLWLAPSILGLAMVAVFALGTLRWAWPLARPLADTGFSLRSSVRHVVTYRQS